MLALASLAIAIVAGAPEAERPKISRDPNYFPIAVWLQSPANARRYQEIGVNLYVGLWQGPTEDQVHALEEAKMPVICEMNAWAEHHLDRRIIVGWMHGDEPDNAQALPDGKGYGPPVLPAKIVEGYDRIRKVDPSRPVLLNLGQGVAWDGWYGRGTRTNHPEDYPLYAKGADIASFDIYPVTAKNDAIRGKLETVGFGTRRLRDWTASDQTVWACVEATHIDNADVAPTPEQTRTLAWMAIVNGATGLIYFSHQFAPRFIEAGILADEKMAKGVKGINEEIRQLAPVLNSPNVKASADGNVSVLAKRHAGQIHVFAISNSPSRTTATLRLGGLRGSPKVQVVDSSKALTSKEGTFTDSFGPYEMRHYRLKG